MAENVKPGQEVPQGMYLTKDALKELLETVMSSARRMTPLEEKKYKEEIDKENRRMQMMKVLGQAEEEAMARKRDSCSHCVDPRTGDSVARGQGVWITQGQVHNNDVISLICLRCSTVWYFKGTPAERNASIDGAHGLAGAAPPPAHRLIPDTASVA